MNVHLIPHSLSLRTEWHTGDHNDADWTSLYWAVDFSFGVAIRAHGEYSDVGGEIRSTQDDSLNGVVLTLIELGFTPERIAWACDLDAAREFEKLLQAHRDLVAAKRELQRAEERLGTLVGKVN